MVKLGEHLIIVKHKNLQFPKYIFNFFFKKHHLEVVPVQPESLVQRLEVVRQFRFDDALRDDPHAALDLPLKDDLEKGKTIAILQRKKALVRHRHL